jgi:hypothetical protein
LPDPINKIGRGVPVASKARAPEVKEVPVDVITSTELPKKVNVEAPKVEKKRTKKNKRGRR